MTDAAEAELQRLRQEIDERDDLLAMSTHELRNQLHTLTLQLQLARLAANAGDGATTAERIGKAQASLARYVERVTLLLDLTRLNANAYPLQLREADLSQTLRNIVDSLMTEAQSRGVGVTVSLPPSCPALTDPSVLEHIVGNLLLNAFKHAACGTVAVSLEQPDAESARIVVADDGRGIAPDDQQHIFGKFGVARSGGRGSGTGLGLWIVRKLTDALGGTIALTSRLDAGSAFTLTLPLRRGSRPP